MAKSDITLNVDVRARTGKGGARDVRRAGRIPGIIYGGEKAPVAISMDKKQIMMALKSGKFISHTVNLEYKGEIQLVFAQDIQHHPVTDEPEHLDLYRVEKGQQIRVNVPAHFTGMGVSPGIKRGGALNIVRHEVEMYCPADAIPELLEFDVSALEIGDAIRISATKFPPNCTPTITDRDFTIATIAGRSAKDEVVDEKPAAAEGDAAVAGAEGAAAATGAAPTAAGKAPAAGAKAPAAGAKAPAAAAKPAGGGGKK